MSFQYFNCGVEQLLTLKRLQVAEVSDEAGAEKQQRTGGSEKARRNPDPDFSDGVQSVKNSAKQDPSFRKK